MFWKNNNLEISVFESWVVMLRIGTIALNTFKNIHLQSNIVESSKEGAGWWRGGCQHEQPHREWLVCVGPCHGYTRMASFWTAGLAGHSAFELLTKGKGRLILPSNSQEHPLLSSPWSWPRSWSRRQAKDCRRAKQCSWWKEVIFIPPGETPFPPLKRQCFRLYCRQRSWLHLLLKFPFHFTDRHWIGGVLSDSYRIAELAKRKRAF